jgi:hypothetical protein
MRRLLIILPLLAILLHAAPALAQTAAPQATGDRAVKLTNPLNTASVPQLVSNIIKAFVGIVGAVALLIFVYGGFLWLTSAGEASKIQAGKDAMKWAVVGLVVVFSSYALVSFVLSALTKRVG